MITKEKKYTTIILTKTQKVDLEAALRRLGLLSYRELFDWVIVKSKDTNEKA